MTARSGEPRGGSRSRPWMVIAASVAMGCAFTAPAVAQPNPTSPAATSDDARKQPPSPSTSESQKDAARAKYVEGVALVKKAQWSEALASFEESARLYPNAVTDISAGSCERALGRYLKARSTFARALAADERASALPETTVTEVRGFIGEIDRIVARAHVKLEPAEAAIAVDGRPLGDAADPSNDKKTVFAAGVLPPGKASAAPSSRFDLLLDPGAHVIVLSRPGFSDAVVNRTFSPGTTVDLDLKLDRLPATLKINSSRASALVRIDGKDVGPVPAEVLRSPGTYKVNVSKRGFDDYDSTVSVKAGEELKLNAPLAEHKASVFTRWWFWTAAGAVITGGVLVTYFATRPDAVPPPYQGGTTGWVVQPTAFRF